MKHYGIDEKDKELIEYAERVLEKNYNDPKHTVSAAVRCGSSKIYTGVNVESAGYGPCAEPVAIGAAISNGEKEILSIVALVNPDKPHKIIPPCGNCRQLIFNYAPECMVILEYEGKVFKVKAKDLLPYPYKDFED